MEINPDEFAAAILKELERYTDEVESKVAAAVIYVGKKGAKDLKSINKVGDSNTWTKYPQGWTTENKRRKGQMFSEIHNKAHYQLTHLLENGHVIKNGTGRTYGSTREFPHIANVDAESVELLEKMIKEALGE